MAFAVVRKLAVLSICVPFALCAQQAKRGRKYTPPPPTCKVTVTVTKGSNGKPVENAGVVFHPMKNGKDDGNMELKTNEEGKAVLDVIPIGDTVRLQVIAKGFQTYGADYVLEGPTEEINIKLNPPGRQYSIYEKHDGSQVGGQDEVQTPKPEEGQSQPQPH
ncbi:MAG TPA: hypothetical protein VFA02_10495 [Pseudacidobacterium sp.]|nr:hypothetical protein [Pseudacidobacterium sp.]